MRTSNDAGDPFHRSHPDMRKAVDALFRGDCPETICVQPDLALRHQMRAMAAMRPPTFMN
ncbi:hypothetical protein [Sphingobium bisphenolivorans]|uniref:hypothetical protein n=1 Tax=Sphingobium bisphenolivorans TaxID=1335760 RepID=UPI0003A64DA7|nr:hypothetical protein [Sphingobium bisphenolivorans]